MTAITCAVTPLCCNQMMSAVLSGAAMPCADVIDNQGFIDMVLGHADNFFLGDPAGQRVSDLGFEDGTISLLLLIDRVANDGTSHAPTPAPIAAPRRRVPRRCQSALQPRRPSLRPPQRPCPCWWRSRKGTRASVLRKREKSEKGKSSNTSLGSPCPAIISCLRNPPIRVSR